MATRNHSLQKKSNSSQLPSLSSSMENENENEYEENVIAEIINEYSEIPDDVFQKYFLRSHDMVNNQLNLIVLAINEQKLIKLLKYYQKKYCEEETNFLDDNSFIKLSAIMYSNIIDSTEMNVKFVASQIFFMLCSIPMASAYGILTTFVLKNICSVIQKSILEVLHGRTLRKKQNSDEETAPDESPADNLTPFDPIILNSLISDYQVFLPLYSTRNEEYLLELVAEMLTSAVCLCSIKEEYLDTLSVSKGAVALFALRNESTLSASYRSLLPILTLAGRDPRLPDTVKQKILCHDACLEIMLAIITSSHIVKRKDDQPSRRNHRRVSLESHDGVEENEASSESSNFHGITMPFVCAIGFIQRMMMTSSEKIISRAQLTSSLVKVIAAVHDGDDNFERIRELFKSKQKKPLRSKKNKTVPGHVREEDDEDHETVWSEGRDKRAADPIADLLRPHPQTESDCVQRALSTERLLSFILKLSKSAKLNHRSLCLDLAANILSTDWLWQRNSTIQPISAISSHTGVEEMIEILIVRCSDVTATVRGRALSALLDLFEVIQKIIADKNNGKTELIERVYSFVMGRSENNSTTVGRKSLLETLRDLCLDEKPLVKVKAILVFGLMFTIEWPCRHQNNSSFHLHASASNKIYLNDEDVELIADRCTDSSVAVRKQAVVTLTQLLSSRRTDSTLQKVWIESVLPLVHDPESSIQTKISQGVVDLILFGTLAPTHSSEFQATWSLCNKINEAGNIRFLKSAFAHLKRNSGNGGAGSGIMNSLEKQLSEIYESVKRACCIHDEEGEGHRDEEEHKRSGRSGADINDINDIRGVDFETMSRGGWVLLEALISQQIKPSSSISSSTSPATSGKRNKASVVSEEFVIQCWLKKQEEKSPEASHSLDELDTRMLQVLSKISIQIEENLKNSLTQQLLTLICAGRSDTQGIAAALAVIFSFASQTHSGKISYDIEWLQIPIGTLLNYIHSILHHHLWSHDEVEDIYQDSRLSHDSKQEVNQQLNSDSLCSAIFLLGEIAMLGFSMEEDEDTYKIKYLNPNLPYVALSEVSHTFRFEIPSILVMMIQTLMGYSKFSIDDNTSAPLNSMVMTTNNSFNTIHSTNSSLTQDSNDFNTSSHTENSSRIRAQSFITMGKLCLRSRQRARDHMTIFLREIQSSSHLTHRNNSAVRSNAILVLGDLCVRFTNLVDRHVGSMAICLQDPDVLVRRHSFILLTQLLLQDYLKWRGMLLFRFLVTVLDREEEMASLARYVLRHTLQSKYSGFIVQNFTESMIVFNNCTDHVTYQTMAALGSDGGTVVSMEGIDLHGSHGQQQRMKIYEFMLEDITEEEKIQITSNISQDIFSYALDFPIKRSKNTSTGGCDPITPLEYALIDAFQILQSPLLRIGKKSSSSGGASSDGMGDGDDLNTNEELLAGSGSGLGEGMEGNELLKASLHKAKQKVLKKLSLQHLIDHMLPIISSLKHILEAIQSPVQRALMDYLIFIMKNHKQETSQALGSDPTLKEEIEYEIKSYEKMKQNEMKQMEILSAERAVVELEISTARKTTSKLSSLLSSPLSVKGSTNPRRHSLSTSKSMGTPLLKRQCTSEKKRQSIEINKSQQVLIKDEDPSASSSLSLCDQTDDFTLRMISSPGNGDVPKRRWSVSAENINHNSDSDSLSERGKEKAKEKRKEKESINPNHPTRTKRTENTTPKKQISAQKRFHSKENDLDSCNNHNTNNDDDSFTQQDPHCSEQSSSPVKKKKKPSKHSNLNTSSSSTLTGLGQFATLASQSSAVPQEVRSLNESRGSGGGGGAGGGAGGGLKKQPTNNKKKFTGGDVLGALK